MRLQDLISKDYIEIEEDDIQDDSKNSVEVCNLEKFDNVDEFQEKIRAGKILLINVKGMKNRNIEELKRFVEKIKKTCLAIEGDIAGISEDWLLLCPSKIKIRRNKEKNE